MADHYMGFSEAIHALTPEEKKWCDTIPRGRDYCDDEQWEDDEAWVAAMKKDLDAHGIDVAGIGVDDDTLETFPHFEYSTEGDEFWMHTEDSAYLEHVACVVEGFIKKFRPDFVFGLTWCEYCSKPQIGQFDGGWVVVMAEEIRYGSAAAEGSRNMVEMIKDREERAEKVEKGEEGDDEES